MLLALTSVRLGLTLNDERSQREKSFRFQLHRFHDSLSKQQNKM